MIKNIIFLYLLINFINIALANTYDSIAYNLDTSNIKHSVLKVEVLLKGKFKDKLVINLPSHWASAHYTEQIKNIQVSPKSSIEFKQQNDDSQAIITIPKTSNDLVKITYEVHQKVGNPSNVHEAIVRNDLVHAPGYGIFAIPHDLSENDKIKVNINWINLNPTWQTLSSHGTNHNLSLNITALELLHAVYGAGKIRVYNIGTNARSVLVSLYGTFDEQDQKILSDLAGIINSQRKFFNDFNFPYYAISLIEGDNPGSMGGTGLFNSFTAFLPQGMHRTDYYILFAHEYLHNWIGGKIRNNQDEELNYWWTEGFTDFYSRLIAFRSQAIDKNTFVAEVNQFLSSYYLSPVNQEPNSKIKDDFWRNYDIEKLPYYRGFVFALYLNNLIQQENPKNSLDNVMYDLFKNSHKHRFSVSYFKNIVRKYVKNGIDQEILDFIDRGNIISIKHINLPIETSFAGKYHLGFSNLELNSLIQNIDTNSNAYKAGLKDGQQIIGYSFPNGIGYPDQIITIETNDGAFKFKPEHYHFTEVYKIKTKFSVQEEKQFNKFFGLK